MNLGLICLCGQCFRSLVVCIPQMGFHVLFKEKIHSPGSPSKEIVLLQSSSLCAVMDFHLICLLKSVWVRDVAFDGFFGGVFFFFCISLRIAQSDLGIEIFSFHLWIMPYCGRLNSQLFAYGFIPLSRPRYDNINTVWTHTWMLLANNCQNFFFYRGLHTWW